MTLEAPPAAGEPRQLHFLLVEDNPLDAELIQRELRRAGFGCTFAVVQTPQDFTRELQEQCPDIVLADYSLPQWSGMEALDILKRETPQVPLILVSGMLGEETAVDCIKKGATDYVLKRALARLPVAIRRALQERLEREHRQLAEELFRRAVELSPSGMLIVEESGNILLANAEAERLFGYEANGLTWQPVEKLVPGRLRGQHRGHRAAYHVAPLKHSMGQGRELYGLRKDGTEFPCEIGLNPIQTATGTQTLIAVVDITERRRAEREAEEYTEELKRSNAELEQFAYIASHDLQEPLRMVASYTELLAERYRGQLDDKADKYIGYAVDGAHRMQRLIRDLLAFARVSSQAKPLLPVDAGAVLTSVLTQLQQTIEKSNAQVVWKDMPAVSADDGQLGQVFQNLIGNACKFHGAKAPRIEIRAEKAGDMWQFSVVDNGIGIDMENCGRIFQMFQRLHTREEYEGTGIGLAIAKRIVERHGGKIWFDSVPGEGTTFQFTIPGAERGEHERAVASAAGGG